LIIAGVLKAKWQMHDEAIPFSTMMLQLRPYFIIFFLSGILLITGFYLILFPLLRNQLICQYKKFFIKYEEKRSVFAME